MFTMFFFNYQKKWIKEASGIMFMVSNCNRRKKLSYLNNDLSL